MFLTLHAAAGLIVAESVTSKLAGFLLGIISHIILDIIPHGDFGLNKWVAQKKNQLLQPLLVVLIDIILLLVFVALVFRYIPVTNFEIAYWTIFGALLPDLTWSLNRLLGNKSKFLLKLTKWHNWLPHKIQDKLSFKSGLFVQLTTLVILIWAQIKIFN